MRIGRLNYVNAYPLYEGLKGVDLILGTPAELNAMLLDGKLEISLISSVEFLKHRDRYHLLPHFCIAAEGPVQSVNLYTKGDLDGKQVALFQESASSSQLLKILCKHFWHIEPEFVPLSHVEACTNYDGFLLIGDQALLAPKFPGYQTIDLAQVWHEKTHLPMTFAVFAAQKNVNSSPFEEKIDASLRWSEENRDEMIQRAAKASKLPARLLQNYYPLLSYRFGEKERAGLNTFAALSGYAF